MLRQNYVADTYCHSICSDNYIYCTKLLKWLENDYKMVEQYLAN